MDKTKELLIVKTLQLIGEKGTMDISVREITDAAKMNVAAINYHFKGKKQLFKEMEEYIINETDGVYEKIDIEKPIESLEEWAYRIINSVIKYPGILIFLKEVFNNESDKVNQSYYKSKHEMLEVILKKVFITDYEYKKNIFMSSLIMPSISTANTIYGLKQTKTMTEDEKRIYIKKIINLLV